eukprot:gene1752-1863_t
MKKPSYPRSPIPSSSSSNDYISSVFKSDRNFSSDEQHHYHEDQYDLIFGLYDFEVPQSIHEQNLEELKQIEEARRNERLSVHDSCRNSYNNGDFNKLLTILKDKCDYNIHFVSPNLFLESFNVYGLFAFLTLISLVYPDSMVRNLEKRISRFAQPKPPVPSQVPIPPVTRETVEMIDKFTGTRVFHSPLMTVFGEFLKLQALNNPSDELTAPIISQMLSGILYTNESTLHPSEGKIYHLITETKLEFDLITNKVISWTYTLLAVTTS